MNVLSALLLVLGSVAAIPTGLSKVQSAFKINQIKSLNLVSKKLDIGDLYSGAFALDLAVNEVAFVSMMSIQDSAAGALKTVPVGAGTANCSLLDTAADNVTAISSAFSGFSQMLDATPFPNTPVVYQGTATCVQTAALDSRYQLGFVITNGGTIETYTVYAALDASTYITNAAGFFAITSTAYTMNGTPAAFELQA